MTLSPMLAGVHDFDFLFGSWQVVNERLKSRLTGSDEWETFTATQECQPILGGAGNVDRMTATWRGVAFEGVSLRVFNPTTDEWSIYWVDTVTHELQPPVVGKFVNGLGLFYGDDQHAGKPVVARFIWSDITADAARWEQAFSEDHGKTWETNWIMTFTRRRAA